MPNTNKKELRKLIVEQTKNMRKEDLERMLLQAQLLNNSRINKVHPYAKALANKKAVKPNGANGTRTNINYNPPPNMTYPITF
jgi:hypothetical protein